VGIFATIFLLRTECDVLFIDGRPLWMASEKRLWGLWEGRLEVRDEMAWKDGTECSLLCLYDGI
jgi:hypothetical protein